MSKYFVKQGSIFTVASDELHEDFEKLPAGNYLVKLHPMQGFYLEQMEPFALPGKLYGNHEKDADRIINTFLSRPRTTGVMLSGEKGSGKTMLTKLIANKTAKDHGMPTLVINNPFAGDAFADFLGSITQPCVLLFDEFEKVYDSEHQQMILTLMDGVFDKQKMFLLTCNDQYAVDRHMHNRPGRIFYHLDYKGLDVTFVREYCLDKLNNHDHIDAVCALSNMFTAFNFDMLQALVEEMNRYNEAPGDALRMLNCKPTFDNKNPYTVQLKVGTMTIPTDWLDNGETWHGNPIGRTVYITWYDKSKKTPEGDVDEDHDDFYRRSTFESGNLVHLDGMKGKYIFKNKDGEELILTKKVENTFDYRGTLGMASSYEAALQLSNFNLGRIAVFGTPNNV